MSEMLEWRTRTFFDYWRRRLRFIRSLTLPEYFHEVNVLVWAAIDALGNLWARSVGKGSAPSGKRDIFDIFLARYGGDPFHRVSLPDVWHRADMETKALPAEALNFLRATGGRRKPTVVEQRRLRLVDEDPSLSALTEEVIRNCHGVDRTAVEHWLRFSRYGSIAYKRMRSAFIHEGRPGEGTHSFRFHESLTSPTYLSGIFSTPAILGFEPEFMSNVLERCIDEFEKEALKLKIDPVPHV